MHPGDDPCQPTVQAPGRNGKVCFLTSNFPRWEGDSTTPFVLHLAQDLQDLGWAVEVLAPHAAGAAREEVLGGVPVFRFRYLLPESAQTLCYQGGALINLRNDPLNWFKVPALVVAEAWALWRLGRRRHYRLIHAHWVLPQGFVAAIIGRLLGLPVIVTVHGGDVFALQGKLFTAFKRLAFRWSTGVTYNSSATGQIVKALAPNHPELHKIPMGASPPKPPVEEEIAKLKGTYCNENEMLLLFVGRLVEEKGLGDLLQAMRLLKYDGISATLLVLGEGQDRPGFEAQTAELGLEELVHFLDWVQPAAVSSFMYAADALVVPSKKSKDGWVEGQGLTIVEAMFHRLPVIGSRSGGITDTIEDLKTGFLVNEASPAEIAGAVKYISEQSGTVSHIVEAALKAAEHLYTRQRSAHSFEVHYRLGKSDHDE